MEFFFPMFVFWSSNCVVNLTADKKVVLKEAYRVLKVGNHFYNGHYDKDVGGVAA